MEDKNNKASGLMPLLVLTLLTLCLLLVLLTGAKLYRQLVDRGEAQYAARTASQYLATRLRQAEHITITAFGDGDALALGQQIQGEDYVTYIYCHDGFLRELFCPQDAALLPADGEALLEARSLTLSLEEGLLTAVLSDQTLVFHLRTGREAPP